MTPTSLKAYQLKKKREAIKTGELKSHFHQNFQNKRIMSKVKITKASMRRKQLLPTQRRKHKHSQI